MKLFYFDLPGRAEVSRIMMHVGDVAFQDVRFNREEWVSKYKALSPTGQSPLLELDDGTKICQSSAISYYAASVSGFLPSDAVGVARTMELLACFDDVFNVMAPTFGIAGLEERIARRKELIAPGGALYNKLQIVEKLLAKSSTKYYLGDKPTLADATVFAQASAFGSGMFDGFDKDCTKAFPTLAGIRDKFAAEPKVAAYYVDKGDKYASYK